ncbi:MAG TPA: FAD binding domain-containing protein [Bacillota bacterium]|nr:FAD binding domain-containing protein [Bacillota bacterium]
MIPFDFEYYRPDTLGEAVELYQTLSARGLAPLYFGGGTEIISMARLNTIRTGAVIDIKSIPECNTFEIKANQLIIGAAVTLTRIMESGLFPLLGKSGGRVADHTIRGKITVGGNLCGKIIYREAILPFLLAESEVVIIGPGGERRAKILEVFQQTMQLNPGELLVQLITGQEHLALPHNAVKKTRLDKIDYPVVTIAALKKDGRIRVAISGLCAFPFRLLMIEDELNNQGLEMGDRVNNTIRQLPAPILSDIQASAEYREFVYKNTLLKIVRVLNEVS